MLGRRADGYHDLDTIAVFAELCDSVTAAPSADLTLSVSGPFSSHSPAGSDNLVMKAATLLREQSRGASGASITLTKNIPAGAGFGGGSADSAAALQLLNALWGLGLSADRLGEIGLELGADVPMCLVGKGLRARGIGERIEVLPELPPLPLVLLWPMAIVSTARVFSAQPVTAGPPLPEMSSLRSPAGAAAWLSACRNDLEDSALRIAPEISESLETLRATRGCLLARMSGSGSGCFGLYPTRAEAAVAAKAIQDLRKGWWIMATEAR